MARTIYKANPKGIRYVARLAKLTKERAADKCVARQCQRAMTADELDELARNDRRSAAVHASWDVVRAMMGKFDYEDPRANEIFLREMEKRGYVVKR